ncbi:MAG: methyltransferase [Bacillales bacterium]|nr:methyltransferase [Bacillales bacterium]
MAITLDYLPGRENIKLYQDHSMICINTDTMVLGEFLEVYRFDTVLDIGTNNGSLLLYASRFSPKKLIGLEINKHAIELAKKNLELNNIDNYCLINEDANTYRGELVDVIVCNPPYFKVTKDSKNSSINMTLAKHEDSLPLENLVKTIFLNLKDNGKLFFVYQSSRLQELIDIFSQYHLAIKVMQFVYNINKENSNVVLIKAVKNGKNGMEVKKPLIIKDMKVEK